MSTMNIKNANPADAVSAALAGAAAPAAIEQTRPVRQAKSADKRGWWWGTGRRKTAIARVRIRPAKGEGSFAIMSTKLRKSKPVDVYFTEVRDQSDCTLPLRVAGVEGKFEIKVTVNGGGCMGQAGAIMLGVARALIAYDPALYPALREQGLMTRDSREVERKKYGQAGARRRFQFSKR